MGRPTDSILQHERHKLALLIVKHKSNIFVAKPNSPQGKDTRFMAWGIVFNECEKQNMKITANKSPTYLRRHHWRQMTKAAMVRRMILQFYDDHFFQDHKQNGAHLTATDVVVLELLKEKPVNLKLASTIGKRNSHYSPVSQEPG